MREQISKLQYRSPTFIGNNKDDDFLPSINYRLGVR